MIEQIREIGEILAPKLFGKPYGQLQFDSSVGKLKTSDSELFHCAAAAQSVRLEALKMAQNQGLDPAGVSMNELLYFVDQVLDRPNAIELQKSELRKRGFLPSVPPAKDVERTLVFEGTEVGAGPSGQRLDGG